MPILGLVLVLDDATPATRGRVGVALASAEDLDLGEVNAHRWPAVLDAPDAKSAEARIGSLSELPGIASVDVVYADFEDLLTPPVGVGVHEVEV